MFLNKYNKGGGKLYEQEVGKRGQKGELSK